MEARKDFYGEARWFPLYGSPREPEQEFAVRAGSKLARRMNCGFVEGNTYRGMLYMSVSAGLGKDLPPVKRRAIAMVDPKPPANYVLLSEVRRGGGGGGGSGVARRLLRCAALRVCLQR